MLRRCLAASPIYAPNPLLFDPGARWQYGINTDVVGNAVPHLDCVRSLGIYWSAVADWILGDACAALCRDRAAEVSKHDAIPSNRGARTR